MIKANNTILLWGTLYSIVHQLCVCVCVTIKITFNRLVQYVIQVKILRQMVTKNIHSNLRTIPSVILISVK